MYRAVFVAFLCAAAALSARAAELCVACQEPAASYRCTVESPSEKYALGEVLEEQICSKVLAQKGPHKKCALMPLPEGGTCEGVAAHRDRHRLSTRATAGADESTYEVGAFEVARQGVHDTWLCVTSMFKDC